MSAADRIERWRVAADRASWWGDNDPRWPYPTHVALIGEHTDAEWLAQGFREAASRAHEYGIDEPPDPILEAVARAAEAGDPEAKAVVHEAHRHLAVEDADYDCPHPWCQRIWPMVRAAEARARLEHGVG